MIFIEPQDVRSWIICDGDVDPEWIESLNSVLDDNHLLTLPNGERINFGPNVNFLFETHDLKFASPATISRMGMIFLSDEDMDIKRIVQKWFRTLESNDDKEINVSNLQLWIDELFYAAFDLVWHKYEHVVTTTAVGTLMNGLSHVAHSPNRSAFVCNLIRGLGANVDLGARSAFAKELFTLANERPPDFGAPLDCFVDSAGRYQTYETKQEVYENIGKETLTPVVPTISVQRTLDVIQPWVKSMQPFLIVGPEGCGKNMVIQHAFGQVKSTSLTVLHCNAQTTAEHVVQRIKQSCSIFSTNQGRVFRPRDTERLVLYLKDINLPKPDQYESCMLIAFLQQLITCGGFYDENLEFLGIERIQVVASMNAATTVGRHPLSTRFTAVVRVAAVDYPTSEELSAVYTTLLRHTLAPSTSVPTFWQSHSAQEKLANGMVQCYETIRSKFSVDDHRHYLFTPRDLTKWTRGLLRYELDDDDDDPETRLLECWTYEARRLFRDRLVDSASQLKYDSVVNTILRQHWKYSAKSGLSYFTSLENPSSSGGASQGLLRQCTRDRFEDIVAQGITMYEREEKDLNMLLFPEILEHIAVIDRVLSEDQEGGSLLLVGKSGVGRRTASTLVAHMHGYAFMTPSLTREYGVKEFCLDLKNVFQSAGMNGQHTVLYVEDHQFTQPAMLEIINSVLSSGEVPGLYTHEELEPLLSPLKEEMMELGHYRTVYDFFIARVQQYCHVILGMDSDNQEFAVRCESNPALFTRCSLVWMGEWSSQSMAQIPDLLCFQRPDSVFFTDAAEDSETIDRQSLSDAIALIFNSCRSRGATPRQYIGFLHTWEQLYTEKSKSLRTSLSHLRGGLGKLEEASLTVDELSTSAGESQRKLSHAQIAADEAMEEITNALAQAKSNRKEVEELKIELAVAEEETSTRKGVIESELSSITPLLQSAKEAVGLIKSDNLNEIRSLKMPPEPIHDVLSAVLMLLGIQDTSWLSMKKFLGSRGVKEEILNYDAHRVTPDIRKSVLKLLKTKGSSFDHETITRVSVAAAPLASWVKANVKYAMVLEKIEPLERDLAEATQALESSQDRLSECASELADIDAKVGAMKIQFSAKTQEAEKLRMGLTQAEETLDKAQGLLRQLSGEQKRWSEQGSDIQIQIQTLPVQMLMAAGFTCFLGQASEDIRASVTEEWQSSLSCRFHFKTLMSSESEMLQWKSLGLPMDVLSMENGLVVNSCRSSVPFIIDPANVCTAWLAHHLAQDPARPLAQVMASDVRLVNHIEQAVRFGKTLLLLDVEGVDPYLYPLIRRDLCHQGPRYVVQLGDKVLDYNENFRLVLVTRHPLPNLAPDAKALVIETNFTTTRSGLESQLLSVTLEHERPELEVQKSTLLQQEEAFKLSLAKLEKELLEALSTSEGDILENTTLIQSLSKTKTTSADIEDALEQSAEKSAELDAQRNTYRGFAQDGAKLYFILTRLRVINPMYEFSLESFIGLFNATLTAKEDKTSDVHARLQALTPMLEIKVLYFVGRSLFKHDRLMFALHLVHGMYGETLITKDEWTCFSGETLISESGSRDDFPTWASADRAQAYAALKFAAPRVVDLAQFHATDLWTKWTKSLECDRDFPLKIEKQLSAFQKVLVIATFRPDRLESALTQFVCERTLGIASVNPPPLDLADFVLTETKAREPVLFVTTVGADPSQELEELAVNTRGVGKDRYTDIAMGGGQSEKALRALQHAAEHGEWLCLQNLHLVIAWLPTLEKEWSRLTTSESGLHANFRLWLTSESHEAFPLRMLKQSLKITVESPPGLKKNLQRTYSQWAGGASSSSSSSNTPTSEKLLFLLAWYHALSQERRTYVPQGWSKAYEFSTGDLRAGAQVMTTLGGSVDQEGVEWDTLHGLMENAVYGGRVDNPYDLRVLRAYLRRYFNDAVFRGDEPWIELRNTSKTRLSLRNSTKRHDFLQLIQDLPEDCDTPHVFGLPDNIAQSLEREHASRIVAQLRTLASFERSVDRFDRDSWRLTLGPILDLWTKLTNSGSSSKSNKTSSSASESGKHPLQVFVALEREFASSLVESVDRGLAQVKKVVYGSALLTPHIQELAKALLLGQVPDAWAQTWDELGLETNLGSWLRALTQRHSALGKWQHQMIDDAFCQHHALNLSDLLHPGTFLNALRQQTARNLECSMDRLELQTAWNERAFDSEVDRVVEIKDLALQGAAFERQVLCEAHSNSMELVPVPSVYMAYVMKNETTIKAKKSHKSVSIPLYFNRTRERLLAEIDMPMDSAEEADQWIMAGVALFLAED